MPITLIDYSGLAEKLSLRI